MTIYLERVLFVVAPQGFGKSTQLRAMFLDPRLGNGGKIPTHSKLPDTYSLGRERRLYLRLTSPHEYGESSAEFIRKARGKMDGGRWNFAGALQPNAFKRMPDVVETVRRFQKALTPERVRLAFLAPNRQGITLDNFLPFRDLHSELQALGAEVVCVDARNREANGLLLADFFDFT